ncbi:MAG: hypothetical protein LBQ95_07920 [Lachnospiraceae bacterium]|jgi:hypothetical protein|nr:hypothetical protein [Lachnospiraceae bacterium]
MFSELKTTEGKYMQKKLQALTKTILFLILAVALIWGLNLLCKPRWNENWFSTPNVSGMYDLPKDSIEALGLGTSITLRGFSPLTFYEEYGISAYNLATEAQPMMGSYYLLKEFLRNQSPKVVYVEVWGLFDDSNNEAMYRKAFDYMKLSSNKWEAIKERSKMDGSSSLLSYVFPLYMYHTGWKDINKAQLTEFNATEHPLYFEGFVMNNQTYYPDEEISGWTSTGSELYDFVELNYKYLKKITDLCRSKGIQVILYKGPEVDWSKEKHNTVQKFADEAGVPFIDFRMKEVIDETGFDFSVDMADPTHTNTNGAIEVSSYLALKASEFAAFKDGRLKGLYPWLDESLARFNRERLNEDLTRVWDGVEYLSRVAALEKEDYTVYKAENDLGEATSVIIAGTEYLLNQKGLNIVVYDNQNNHVVDSVTIDTSQEGELLLYR